MVTFRQNIFLAFFAFFRFSSAEKPTSRICPVYQFYDHGTEKCESCCDICCHAEFFNTVAQCKRLCKEYAEKLNNKRQEAPLDVDSNPQDGDTDVTSSGFPLGAVIAVSGIALLLSVFLSLIIAKRKAIVRVLYGQNEPTANVEDPPEETIPLQTLSGRVPVVHEERETEDEEAMISTTTTVGVQESEKPSEGENSWQLLPPSTAVPARQPTAYSPRGGESTSPTQESVEGQLGTAKLVTGMGAVTESTVPKTLLDSLPQSQL